MNNPQVAIINSIIFRVVDGPKNDLSSGGDPGEAYFGKNGVAWVLRFGGLCAIFGALATRKVGPTPTERDMRRHLGEVRLLGEEPTP
jgi:solute carrier family 45 protein 1/2/4